MSGTQFVLNGRSFVGPAVAKARLEQTWLAKALVAGSIRGKDRIQNRISIFRKPEPDRHSTALT